MRRARRSLEEELLRKVDFGLISEYLVAGPARDNSTESERISERHTGASKTASEFDDQVLMSKSVLEKNGPKSASEPERGNRPRTKPGRRSKEPLIKQVEQAYAHLHDLDWLEKCRLAQLPEVQERVDSKHPMAEAQTLRRLLMAAARQIVQVLSEVPDKGEVRTFLEMYLDGKSVTEIAHELGKSREWVSRAYRKEALTLTGTQFIKLISADDPPRFWIIDSPVPSDRIRGSRGLICETLTRSNLRPSASSTESLPPDGHGAVYTGLNRVIWSGRGDSNPRPSAWEAFAPERCASKLRSRAKPVQLSAGKPPLRTIT